LIAYKLFLLIILTYSVSAASQVVYVEEWLGNWESMYKQESNIRVGTVKENILIEEIHKKRYVHFSINGGFVEDSVIQFKYSSDIFLTVDLEAKNIRGVLIDDNGYKGMMILVGTITDTNQITLEGDCLIWQMTSTFTLKTDGKLYRENIFLIKETSQEVTTRAVFSRY
jgi:hypothetical protein